MQRVYGLDLDHTLTTHGMKPRRLAALAVNLPDGSQIWRKLDTPNAWTVDEYLLAMQADQMNMWIWGNADPKRRGPKPKPIPRPGQTHKQDVQQSSGGAHKADRDNPHTSRHITAKGMTVDQLDRFMTQPFIDRKR